MAESSSAGDLISNQSWRSPDNIFQYTFLIMILPHSHNEMSDISEFDFFLLFIDLYLVICIYLHIFLIWNKQKE